MPATDPSVEKPVVRALERTAFSIAEFCFRHSISLATFHKQKRAGLGPAEMRVGNVVRITLEEELKWQRALTHPKGDEAKAKARAEAAAVARGRNAGKLAAQSPRHVSKRKRQSA